MKGPTGHLRVGSNLSRKRGARWTVSLKRFLSIFLGLANTRLETVDVMRLVTERRLAVGVRPTWRKPRCGECGRLGRRLHGLAGKEREWRHLGPFGVMLILVAVVHRVLCRFCGVKTMMVPWARTGSIFTRGFEDEVAWFLQRTDQTATSQYFGLDWPTVGRIARRVTKEKLDGQLLRNLRFLGVDEIFYGRPRKFLTVVVDHERGRVIWAAEGQSSATLERFFSEIGEEERLRIEVVSMDMDPAFAKAVRRCAPQAEIVYDRFHVVKLLSEAVDEVRREQVRQAADVGERQELKRSRWALLKNPWNLTKGEGEKLSTLAQSNGTTYRSYLLKEAFQMLYAAPTVAKADTIFADWYGWARRSRLAPFIRVAETMRKHWPGIRRFLERRITNASSEGWNSKIRMLSHRAFGFHSADALIGMIHLCCSGLVIKPVGYS